MICTLCQSSSRLEKEWCILWTYIGTLLTYLNGLLNSMQTKYGLYLKVRVTHLQMLTRYQTALQIICSHKELKPMMSSHSLLQTVHNSFSFFWVCILSFIIFWAVCVPANKVVTWLATLHFGPYLARWAVWEVLSDQSTGHVKPELLCDCPSHILQIAVAANKYPTLFYLKGACRYWLKVTYTTNHLTVCKQMINIKFNYLCLIALLETI